MSDTYVGTVIRDGVGQVQVYIPALDGPVAFGSWRAFGSDQGNALDATSLYELRSKCRYAYVASELSSGGFANFNEETCQSTMQDSYRAKGQEFNLRVNIDPPQRYFQPDEGRSFALDQAQSTDNLLVTSILDDTAATVLNRSPNKPKGSYHKLTVNTRVLVQSFNNGSQFVITHILPWSGEAEQHIPQE